MAEVEYSHKLSLKDSFIMLSILVIASLANVFLKIGGTNFSLSELLENKDILKFSVDNRFIILGYVLYIIPTFLTLILYKKYKVGYIQALVAGVYIFTPLFAFIANIESFNFLKIFGIFIIFCAVAYLSLSKDETN